jgi:carbon monoxide dehydrogenase subunit G
MGFSLEHSFLVKAPADRVWAFLTDPGRVASALPGAAITEKVADDSNNVSNNVSYNGTITIKVGPVSARYRGTVRFESLDPGARTARIVGSGQDTSGRGGADLRMSSRLVEKSSQETEVSLTSEVNVTGILAQFGRGMIQDVSNQMVGRFTEAMRAQLEVPAADAPENAAPSAAPPIEALSFAGRIAGRAALRLVRRPVFWLVVAGAAVVAWLLARR